MMTSAPASLPRPFVHLAQANLLAQAAEQLSLAAVPMLAVLLLDAGAAQVGLLGAAQTLPFLLLSLPLGLAADRLSRRRLMVLAESLRVLAPAGLVVMVIGGQVSLPGLALMGFIGAAGTVAFSVAAPASVPALVPPEQLSRANGRLELARSAAYAGGPALAGALVAWAGASSAFVLATLLSGAAVLLLRSLPEIRSTPGARRHPLLELREGAAFVRRQALLWPILLTAVVWNISWCVLQAAYLPHALKTLGMSPQAAGLTLAANGVGMVLGALAAARLMAAWPAGRAIVLGPVVSVAGALAMLATLGWPSAGLAALAFFLFGAGPIVWTVATTTLRQTLTPPAMLGRVTAIFLAANAGARPLGAALGGAIGAWGGDSLCLWVAAAGFVLQALLVLASPVRGFVATPPQSQAQS